MDKQSQAREVVVVTGGAGFIGSHTVERLLEQGHEVIVLDNYSTGKKENLAFGFDNPRLHIFETNIVDGIWPALSEVESRVGNVTRIIHLAAQTAVVSSIANPLDDVRLNYATTVHVLEYARYRRVKKVVFSSSAAIYGDTEELPVREDVQYAPVSPYGIDKLGSEYYMGYYSKVHGIPTTPLRFFNVYGPRQDPKSSYSGVISIFFDRAIQNQQLRIYGDGLQTRDFVYVGDVARAIVAATFRDDGAGEPINIGTGSEVSVNQLAELVIGSVKSTSEIVHVDARAGEILRSCADISRAREQLDYVPAVTIEQGLMETASFFRETS
ncbi:MAG: NAD-dependent epimerase/dehydratase family protein [Myxococcota bacterium]